jgi:hypothetical protein
MVSTIRTLGILLAATALLVITGCGGGKTKTVRKPPIIPVKKSTPAPTGGPKAAAVAEGWGDLKLRFVYDGDVPKPKKLAVAGPDAAFCKKNHPVNEDLIVGPNGGLANVVVYLRTKNRTVKIHPDYEALAEKPVKVVNKNCRFAPHITTVWTERTLTVSNDDTIAHNTKADLFKNEPFNIQIGPGRSIDRKLTKSEIIPNGISCGSHTWMTAYLLVRDTPYMGVSGADGTLEIKNLPAGEWKFILWHEKSGYLKEITVDGSTMTLKKGIVDWSISPDASDVKVIKVASSGFNK